MASETFEIRNLSFDLDGVPRYWHGGKRSVTLFMNNLSLFFPPGERFFIQSVKAHASRVQDPSLRRDIKLFTGQEGIHSREHVAYNKMIEAHGYPARALEGRVERLLRRAARLLPASFQLAVTCALEHFTALMAHVLLADDRLLEGAHPTMAALWRWHAAEENEHKAVAYDVYQTIGGSYFVRVSTMFYVTLVFWALVVVQQARLMWVDGCLFSLREWARLVRHLFVEPGGLHRIVVPYLQYYSPGFHPWDHDNQSLLDAWKAELGRSPVYGSAIRGTAGKARAGLVEATS